ncbi:MAG: M28 family peptidase [Chloroflexota bacterium]|jgi:Zn-dependent M28 family amino/carboxypeptidase
MTEAQPSPPKRNPIIRAAILIIIVLFIAKGSLNFIQSASGGSAPVTFDEQRAFRDVQVQVNSGARIPDSQAHIRTVEWLISDLKIAGWQVELQKTTLMGHAIQNVIAKRGAPLQDVRTPLAQQPSWVILGAHYDSRLVADKDPDPTKRQQPVLGANDGASGVAVLLELARILPRNFHKEVWLVFFDAEDNGGIEGWDWLLGSRAFADSLTRKPDAVVILDMIGDKDLNIYQEMNSTPALNQQIWDKAAALGYQTVFIPKPKYSLLDDHTPFLQKGIPAVDIIDFDYPAWHTTTDTLDKVSPQSLKVVGDVVFAWLKDK